MMARGNLSAYLVLLFVMLWVSAALKAPVGAVIKRDSAKSLTATSQFASRSVVMVESEMFGTDARHGEKISADSSCSIKHHVKWSARMSSSVYGSALLSSQLGTVRHPAIVVPCFAGSIDVMDTEIGESLEGWPFFHEKMSFQSAPLIYDVDRDGSVDVIAVSGEGVILALNRYGIPLLNFTYRIPPLNVDTYWWDEAVDEVRKDPTEGIKDEMAASKTESSAPLESATSQRHGETRPLFEEEDLFIAPTKAQRQWLSGRKMDDDILSYVENKYPVKAPLKGRTLVDAHVLSSPVLATFLPDIGPEMVIPVTYYFESEEYGGSQHSPHRKDVDPSNYLAAGVVVISPISGKIRLSVQLDLSMNKFTLRAFLHAPLSTADIDGDGILDIIAATSVGHVYVLSGRDGTSLPGWPILMADTQGSIAAANIEGSMRLFVGDMKGNVAAFTANGMEVWSVQVSGSCLSGVSLADLDDDGKLEVVFGTTSGALHILQASNGLSFNEHWPMRLNGRLQSPITVLPSGTLLVLSSLGSLLVIDPLASPACAFAWNVDETSYASILVHHAGGSPAETALFLPTMSGNVYGMQANLSLPEMQFSLHGHNSGRTGFVSPFWKHGLSVRSLRGDVYVTGAAGEVTVDILHDSLQTASNAPVEYTLSFEMGGLIIAEYSVVVGRDQKFVIPAQDFFGEQVVMVMCQGTDGSFAESELTVHFNSNAGRLVKWLLLLPLLFAAWVLIRPPHMISRDMPTHTRPLVA